MGDGVSGELRKQDMSHGKNNLYSDKKYKEKIQLMYI